MEQKIFIIGYSAYEFTDEKKEVRKGGKISYISESPLNEDLKKGYLPVQSAVDFGFCTNLPVPCLANVKYIGTTDSNNKLIMKIGSIEIIKPNVNVDSLFASK